MNRLERIADEEEKYRIAFEAMTSGLWTALPAIVESYDATRMTVTVQPSIKGRHQLQTGEYEDAALPVLPDVPVVFPSGGGYTLTFPIAVGDECLVIFASRCIDAWWQSGGIQKQAKLRKHSLSDGFALFSPRSQPRVLTAVSTTKTQLRSDDGATFLELSTTEVKIKAPTITLEASTKIKMTAPLIEEN